MADNFAHGTVLPFIPLTAAQRRIMLLDREDYSQMALSRSDRDDSYLGEEELTDEAYAFGEHVFLTALVDDEALGVSFEVADRRSMQRGEGEERTYYLYFEEGLPNGGESVLQTILAGLDEEQYPYLTYECAYTSSKMRPGEFGGAACFITRDNIRWMSTNAWLSEREASFGTINEEIGA